MDVDLGDFSGDVPTLDMVDRVRRMLADSGADPAQVASLDPVIMAVLIRLIQINGRKRGILNCKKGLEEADLIEEVKKDKNILKYIDNKKTSKIIFIKDKLINILLNE